MADVVRFSRPRKGRSNSPSVATSSASKRSPLGSDSSFVTWSTLKRRSAQGPRPRTRVVAQPAPVDVIVSALVRWRNRLEDLRDLNHDLERSVAVVDKFLDQCWDAAVHVANQAPRAARRLRAVE